MGDHIVQLPGQAQALLDHRPAGQLLPGPLQFGRLLLQPGGVGTIVVGEVAQQPGRRHDSHVDDQRNRPSPARGELDGRQPGLCDGQAGQRDPPIAVGRHRIDRHQDGHPENIRRQVEDGERQPAGHNEDQHGPREPPPCHQRQGVQQYQRTAQDEPAARQTEIRRLEHIQGRRHGGGQQRQRAVEHPGAGRQPPRPAGPLTHDLTLPPPSSRHIHPQATTPCTPRVTPHVLNGWTSSSTDLPPRRITTGLRLQLENLKQANQPPTVSHSRPHFVSPRQGASSRWLRTRRSRSGRQAN
jgi:hypothetical protein